MARKKTTTQVISITGAAKLFRMHPWQVSYICQKYQMRPLPVQTGQDKRCKWFSRALLLALIQEEYMPLAS